MLFDIKLARNKKITESLGSLTFVLYLCNDSDGIAFPAHQLYGYIGLKVLVPTH